MATKGGWGKALVAVPLKKNLDKNLWLLSSRGGGGGKALVARPPKKRLLFFCGFPKAKGG